MAGARYGLVERRRRLAARIALYGSLVVVGSVTVLAHRLLKLPAVRSAETGWSEVAWTEQPAVRLFQQFLRIDTSAETGDEVAGLLYLATPLQAAGIPTHLEQVGARHGLLWAEVEGEDRRALVLLSHVDVEAAHDLANWEHPPFAGVVEPPYIHGRGSFDMKSYIIAQLVAMLELQARHPRPKRSVMLVVIGDEEGGSDLGMRWLLREKPELVRRFWSVLTEGGAVEARNFESIKYWGTEVGQKRFLELIACAPTRQRLEDLRQDIHELSRQPTGLVIEPGIRLFWEGYRSTRDLREFTDILSDPDRLVRDPARYLTLPGYLQAMIRNELVAWPAEPAPGGGWQMRLLFHLLPSADYETQRRRLLPAWMTGGVEIQEIRTPPPATVSPIDHPAMRAIQEEIEDKYGRVPSGPLFLSWTATDSRFLRPLGIPSYGFTPFLILSPETMRMHRPNEKIALPGFADGVDIYAGVVERLAMGEER